ncbi:hypothetical protein I302_107434 [Kwoniella bestiolae CBS 10118]|uniref:Uncharacterized protein n=1 Tax=Kwoniella bestiolae CBS 10118 TaxID=1296100 RepID=A0A1B9FYL0_9TREE|nr:hypothetical protein I302_06825 [Kwoniella bestiolae CBS 10118]OCF23841.1 hypothetical protein I302_06825 [Kwoniella bestiolae CBS 10118]
MSVASDLESLFGSPTPSIPSSPDYRPRPRSLRESPLSSPPADPPSVRTHNNRGVSFVDAPESGPSTRRRNLDESLNIRRGDQRGLSQILQERRRGSAGAGGSRNDNQLPVAQARARAPAPGRRESIVEVEDDSDDDIVFTGENLNPNPNPVVPPPRPGGRERREGNGRAPSPGRFRRMMDEIDDLLFQRGAAHDAIINDQDDERRRQILSPPVAAPIPPRRIALGGGGLFRRNQAPAQNDEEEYHPAMRYIPPGPGFYAHGEPGMEEMALRFNFRGLGGLAGGLVIGGGGGGMIRQQQEDVQTILSKINPQPYPKSLITKGFTNDFDMDSIVSKEPIELDDEGNIITRKAKHKKEHLVCSQCNLPLLVSSSYTSPKDKIWVLRCGHMLDECCLDKLQTPITQRELSSVIRQEEAKTGTLDGDGTPEKKRRRKNASRKAKKVEPPRPDEYAFKCPVVGCGREHRSVNVEGGWRAKDGEGALPAYA